MPFVLPVMPPNAPIIPNGEVAGYTTGAFYGPDYSQYFIALITELAKLNYTLSSAGSLEPGSPGAIMKATVETNLQATSNLDSALTKMSDLVASIQSLNKTVETAIHMNATISYKLNSLVTTQQIAVADQIKNNQFQQATTNAALADAGKPPTVIPDQAYTDKLKAAVQDTSNVKLQVTAANLTSQGMTEAVTQSFTIATTMIAKTSFGTWIATQWASLKGSVATMFPTDTAKAVADKTDRATIAAKAVALPPTADVAPPAP